MYNNVYIKRLIRILPDIHCHIKNQIFSNQPEARRCRQLRALKPRTESDAWCVLCGEFESSEEHE